MITNLDIVDEARTWDGTPYRDYGRIKGKRVDCVGLVRGIAAALGISDWDTTAYTRFPKPELLLGLADQLLVKTNRARDDVRFGDVVVVAHRHFPMHLGIIANNPLPFSIIHASNTIGACREHRLDEETRNLIYRVYQYPGVEYV